MRACPLLRRAVLVSLLAASGGCVRQEPPRLAAATLVPEPETPAATVPAPDAPAVRGHWRLRYTRL